MIDETEGGAEGEQADSTCVCSCAHCCNHRIVHVMLNKADASNKKLG